MPKIYFHKQKYSKFLRTFKFKQKFKQNIEIGIKIGRNIQHIKEIYKGKLGKPWFYIKIN